MFLIEDKRSTFYSKQFIFTFQSIFNDFSDIYQKWESFMFCNEMLRENEIDNQLVLDVEDM